MNRKYIFRQNARNLGVSAQTIGEELSRIYEQHGSVRPADVVDAARPEDAPLHPAFEWDDAKAGEAWRLHTARNIIRSVQVVNEQSQPETVYVNVQNAEGQREYQPISVVVQHPSLYALAVLEAQQRINAAKNAMLELEAAASKEDAKAKQLASIKIAMQALSTASQALSNIQ